MGLPIGLIAGGAASVFKSLTTRKHNPGVYTLGNEKYLQGMAKGKYAPTVDWVNYRAATDLPRLEKLLQTQPGASGPTPSTADTLSSTPTMPAGGWATPQGVVPATGPLPPLWFGGNPPSGGRSSSKKRKPRKVTGAGKNSRSGGRRKKGGKKLKFGSPAWRKKYMKKR